MLLLATRIRQVVCAPRGITFARTSPRLVLGASFSDTASATTTTTETTTTIHDDLFLIPRSQLLTEGQTKKVLKYGFQVRKIQLGTYSRGCPWSMALQISYFDTHGVATRNKDLTHGLTPSFAEEEEIQQRLQQEFGPDEVIGNNPRKKWQQRAVMRKKKIKKWILYEKKIKYAQQGFRALRNDCGVWVDTLDKYYQPIMDTQVPRLPCTDGTKMKLMLGNVDHPLLLFSKCFAWYMRHKNKLDKK